jgi:hypothetical protein
MLLTEVSVFVMKAKLTPRCHDHHGHPLPGPLRGSHRAYEGNLCRFGTDLDLLWVVFPHNNCELVSSLFGVAGHEVHRPLGLREDHEERLTRQNQSGYLISLVTTYYNYKCGLHD